MADEEKKIIIDEDWKSQVEAEKEKMRDQPPEGEGKEPGQEGGSHELPPATFETLITSLATQAMAFLGQFPDEQGRAMVSQPHAKHFIDLLAVIEEKSKGNLSQEEAALLSNLQHQLRMLYLAVNDELNRMATQEAASKLDLGDQAPPAGKLDLGGQ